MHSFYINGTELYRFSPGSGLELGREVLDDEDELVFTRQKYLACFIALVDVLIYMNEDGVTTQHAQVTLEFANGEAITSVIVPLVGLEKVDWPNDIDRRCLLNPDVPKANEHIANIIRLQCAEASVKTKTKNVVGQLGGQYVDDVPVFHHGDGLILPNGLTDRDAPDIIFKPVPNKRLAVDPDYTEEQAVFGMRRIVDLSYEAGRILFAHMLLYVMRAAFVTAGIVPKVLVYLFGKTGIKKTTYAQWQTQLYNRDVPLEPLVRLNASIPAAVNLLYENADCVTVLDDLFPARDKDIHRKQEQTLLELTRVIGDGIEPARMRGWKVAKKPPKQGVLVTGEYYIGSGSDGARHLPVHMTIPIDNDKMTVCQQEPLMLSTFYSYFIKWYITNFDDVVDLIKRWFAVSSGTKTGVHARLQNTQFCLEASYKLFLTYCADKGFITRDTSREEYESFYNQLRAIILEQNTRANQIVGDAPKLQIDYLAILRLMYRDKHFNLADSVKRFDKYVHDGVIYRDCLYLRRDGLMDRILAYEPAADFDDLVSYLKWHQALKTGKDSKKSIHLHGGGHGLRFYAIRLAKLRQAHKTT